MDRVVLVSVVFSNNPNGQEYTFLAPADVARKAQIDSPVLIESARGVQTGLFRGLYSGRKSLSDYAREGIKLKYMFDVVDMKKLHDIYRCEAEREAQDTDFLL